MSVTKGSESEANVPVVDGPDCVGGPGSDSGPGSYKPLVPVSGLTGQEDAFCRFMLTYPAADAYMAVFGGRSKSSAREKADRLLSREDIGGQIQYYRDRLHQEGLLDPMVVLKELFNIALFDPGQLFTPEGELIPVPDLPLEVRRAISHVEYGRGGRPIYRVWSKMSALSSLMEVTGMVDKSKKVGGGPGVNIMINFSHALGLNNTSELLGDPVRVECKLEGGGGVDGGGRVGVPGAAEDMGGVSL